MNRSVIIVRLFSLLAILLFGYLFLTSIFITGTIDDISIEVVNITYNKFWPMAAGISFFVVLVLLLGKLYDAFLSKLNKNLLLGIVCFLALFFSIYWVWGSGTAPQADQSHICDFASEFNSGDFSSLQNNSYITMCGQQLGIVTFLRLLFSVFGDGNYVAYQYFSALMVPVAIYSGGMLVRKLSGQAGKSEFFYLIFAGTFFPMYAYTAFVYGDLSSTALSMLACLLLLSCIEKFSVVKVLMLVLTTGIAVQLRRNVLITVIAFLIVIIVKLIQKWNWKMLVTGCGMVCGILAMQIGIEGIYHNVSNNECQELPAVLYVTMGMQEGFLERAGWYNSYNFSTYEENNYDASLAKQVAMQDLTARLQEFEENPSYAFSFFNKKINTQWQAPMYESLILNGNIEKEQTPLISKIYAINQTRTNRLLLRYMKVFQLFTYGCILGWLILKYRKNLPIEKYALLIAVFGGFLFSVIWEAKTRYIFPYAMLMIPYFALGFKDISEMMKKIFKR